MHVPQMRAQRRRARVKNAGRPASAGTHCARRAGTGIVAGIAHARIAHRPRRAATAWPGAEAWPISPALHASGMLSGGSHMSLPSPSAAPYFVRGRSAVCGVGGDRPRTRSHGCSAQCRRMPAAMHRKAACGRKSACRPSPQCLTAGMLQLCTENRRRAQLIKLVIEILICITLLGVSCSA